MLTFTGVEFSITIGVEMKVPVKKNDSFPIINNVKLSMGPTFQTEKQLNKFKKKIFELVHHVLSKYKCDPSAMAKVITYIYSTGY